MELADLAVREDKFFPHSVRDGAERKPDEGEEEVQAPDAGLGAKKTSTTAGSRKVFSSARSSLAILEPLQYKMFVF